MYNEDDLVLGYTRHKALSKLLFKIAIWCIAIGLIFITISAVRWIKRPVPLQGMTFEDKTWEQIQEIENKIVIAKQQYKSKELELIAISSWADMLREQRSKLCEYLWNWSCKDSVVAKDNTAKETQVQSKHQFSLISDRNWTNNLTDEKAWDRWRLNKNSVSQRPYELIGNTVEERAKNILEQSGNPATVWEDIKTVAKVRDLKPEFMVCLYYQENSLHWSSKWDNNPLNNWNNDRWDTVSYTNAIRWWNAAGSTLNNKLLGDYTMTRQLYGSTNPGNFVYTTERNPETKEYSGNGKNNLHNCLSMIYGNKNVSWQFKFRTNDFSYLTELL